ncbi:hypothetical protein JHW43_006546 [Diplocarpon mali]|nr:hypothetical protein JHW43_006546 [Diplocarpon mali]
MGILGGFWSSPDAAAPSWSFSRRDFFFFMPGVGFTAPGKEPRVDVPDSDLEIRALIPRGRAGEEVPIAKKSRSICAVPITNTTKTRVTAHDLVERPTSPHAALLLYRDGA